MRVREGNLTQQYFCDYLTLFAGDASAKESGEEIVLSNLFLHRMSVDGGFHARVLSAILGHESDRFLLLSLFKEVSDEEYAPLPLDEWLKSEYSSAVNNADVNRKIAIAALLRSQISGTNKAAEIVSAYGSQYPESWWQFQTRRLTVEEIENPDMYFGVGRRPFWHAFPLDEYAAVLGGAETLPPEIIYDIIICVAGAWFSTLTREEKIIWLNMPRTTPDEWAKFAAPLLTLEKPGPALSTANWLYASGNHDAALDLYANITLAFPQTPVEKPAFELMGAILSEFGDFDYAFESYKSAFLLARNEGPYETAVGLKNLCEVGDDLGEDMRDYYIRIASIAEELSPDDRVRLYFDLASSARKKYNYLDEYAYLERIIAEEGAEEPFFSRAMSRISEMNLALDFDGKPDDSVLREKDIREQAEILAARGDAAYFGFDPVCALFWYNRSDAVSGENSSAKKFQAAVAAGLYTEAKEYASTPAEKVMVMIMGDTPVHIAARELHTAVTEAWKAGADILPVVNPVLTMLSREDRMLVSDILTDRSTRDDEKALVCSGIGDCYISLGMSDEARQMFRLALRANPSTPVRARIFSEIGLLEYETGNYDASSEAYLSALKMNERFPAAWAGLAKACICQAKYPEALAALENAIRHHPVNTTYQDMRKAVLAVIAHPVDETADRLFTLNDAAGLPAAAALYSEKSPSGFKKEAWDAVSVEDVLKYRN
ncbi:Tetratricopeptide TPR_2 repeat protein [Methanocorpusculum labreanum Z]|uniref:Tetratricopeptide TPR_2 repeat protein n=1 Tax=Methanocorpusculum labreanum (strain ATCC 43576 / DSM 4855 / Z) TaxID=410358 RepID=A2STR0_METLZ|nr:tetratricopeptide repeat protein [Methanocorpusculum labreanum]ABN07716.1 Tetratricopeptide TPR_2 repeat protein [Methanocorpusculum labreanum Z]